MKVATEIKSIFAMPHKKNKNKNIYTLSYIEISGYTKLVFLHHKITLILITGIFVTQCIISLHYHYRVIPKQ